MSHGRPVSPSSRPFLDHAVEVFREHSPDVGASTVDSYEARLATVINRLEDLRLPVDPSEIGLKDGRCFMDELYCEGLERGTVESYVYALKAYAESSGNHSLADLDARSGGPRCRTLTRKEVIGL
ncbi:MAG: hypothetical protein IKR86_00890 [Candidatus Methanomethylophilaceae archaeon]|nr:hypothetical protein [Candidatus Methanomethylophilaceae archaeon]